MWLAKKRIKFNTFVNFLNILLFFFFHLNILKNLATNLIIIVIDWVVSRDHHLHFTNLLGDGVGFKLPSNQLAVECVKLCPAVHVYTPSDGPGNGKQNCSLGVEQIVNGRKSKNCV